MKKTFLSILAVLLLPLLIVTAGGLTSCKEATDGCGKCFTKYHRTNPGDSCGSCITRIDTASDLMQAPECCGCPAWDFSEWDTVDEVQASDSCTYPDGATPMFACLYGVETMACDMDTGGDQYDSVSTTETPDTTTGVDPTTGDPGLCPEYARWNCSGWAIGVYAKAGSNDSWKTAANCPAPYQCQICFGWWGDNDPNYAMLDVTHGLEVCALTEEEARDECEAQCPGYLDGYFPDNGGGGWTLKEIYCDFHGADVAVPHPDHHAVPSSVSCYVDGGSVPNAELHEDNVTKMTEPCDDEDCPSQSECTAWNTTNGIASPGYNIGRTADTTATYVGGVPQYTSHSVKIDDDFLRDAVAKPNNITDCDGGWFDFLENELNGTFNTGDFVKELGLGSTAYDLKIQPASTGTAYDLGYQWFDALEMYRNGDVDFYMTWKQICIGCGPGNYSFHKQRVQVVECGVNACPNP